MTLKEARLLLEQFRINAEQRKHPYILVSFSDEDDKYEVMCFGMDKVDAIVAVSEIVYKFKIELHGTELAVLEEMIEGYKLEDMVNGASKN